MPRRSGGICAGIHDGRPHNGSYRRKQFITERKGLAALNACSVITDPVRPAELGHLPIAGRVPRDLFPASPAEAKDVISPYSSQFQGKLLRECISYDAFRQPSPVHGHQRRPTRPRLPQHPAQPGRASPALLPCARAHVTRSRAQSSHPSRGPRPVGFCRTPDESVTGPVNLGSVKTRTDLLTTHAGGDTFGSPNRKLSF